MSQEITDRFNKFIGQEINTKTNTDSFFLVKTSQATPRSNDAVITKMAKAAQENNRSLRVVFPNDRYDIGAQTTRVTVFAEPDANKKGAFKITSFKQG